MKRITRFDHLDRKQRTEVEVISEGDVDVLAREGLSKRATHLLGFDEMCCCGHTYGLHGSDHACCVLDCRCKEFRASEFRIEPTGGRFMLVKCWQEGNIITRQLVGTYKVLANAQRAKASWEGKQ